MTRGRQTHSGLALLFAFGSAVSVGCAQGPLLLKEVVSREFSIHVGGLQDGTDVREVVSREFSIHVENGRTPYPQVVSREFGLVVADAAAPPVVTELTADLSPTGDTATLDWSGYNQWAVGDIARFDIYFTDSGGFTDVSAMVPYLSVPAETSSATLEGLAEFTDHFFAVVPVDALGNFETAVDYSAAYILSPQAVSREFSLFVGGEPTPPYQEIVSREFGLIIADADPPPVLTDVAMTVSPIGDSVLLDWRSYNQWAVGDIARFDIYLSDAAPFGDVSGMTPYTSVPAETTSLSLDGLTPNTDHYFAVVPVDGLGNFEPLVNYSAAYVLSPEVASREFSIFVGQEPPSPYREVVSREHSIVVPDNTVPAPVTGIDSGFFVETSTTEFGAVVLDWTSYDALAQVDVVAYRIYVGNSFFDDVTGVTPFASTQSTGQRETLPGLTGGEIFHFAVVAEDALGNFDPVVRSFSAKASVSGVGEVINLAATGSTADSLTFSWEPAPDTAAFLTGYHLYFAGATTPLVLQPGTTTQEFTGLTAATGYSLRVATLDIFGQESGGVSIVASTLLPNPANLALTLAGGNVVATWDPVDPSALVKHYAVYLENSPISDTSGLTPLGTTNLTDFDLGPLGTVMDLHVAVATVNVSDASDPNVSSVQATKLSQTIEFPAPASALSIPLIATATSGLPVRFEVDPASLATISGPTGSQVLDALSGGNVTITAYQDGDAAYWPAPPVGQVLRLPPVIASFTADGTEIGPGAIINRIDTLLRVFGLDENGLSQAAFAIRPVGGSFTPIGIDPIAVDGFTAILAIDALPDGAYELQVEITAALTGDTSSVIRPVTVQLAPPVPPTITSPANGSLVTSDTILVEGVASRESEVFVERGGVQVAGPLTTGPAGNFAQSIPLLSGPNVLTARAANRAGASGDSVPVTVTLQSHLTLSLDPPSISEGTSADLTITRNHPQGALTVTLSQSVAGQLQLPPPVSFADGEAAKVVTVSAIDDAVPELDEGVIITGQASNYTSGTALATVIDDDRPTLTLALNRSVVSESAAAGELIATVTRTPVTATPFTVVLASSETAAIATPGSLVMGPFTPTVTGSLVVVDDPDLDGDQISTITARILDVTTGGLLAESNPVAVTVTDDDGPALSLRLAKATVQEGGSVTAFLSRNSGVDQALTVALSVDRPVEASVQPQIDFAIGQAEVSFPVNGTADGTPDGNQSVRLEAAAAGFATAQAEVIVTDLHKPELAITTLAVPSPVLTDEWINYTYRVENQGPADAMGPISVRVLLSDDPAQGDDTTLNTFTFDTGLPSNLFFERTESFRTPIEAGTYWIIIEVDGENVHDEILETNNVGVSNPMEVGASYAATVATDTTVAPSGTPILLTGSASKVSDGSPAAGKLVHVHVMVRDTTRILSTHTDAGGNFSLTFTPLPGEGGSYTVGATHPGVPEATAQDGFTLVGFGSTPAEIALIATRDVATNGTLVLNNLADVGLSGIQVASHGFPAGITLTGNLAGGATTLGPLAKATVQYELTATAAAPNLAEGFLQITSAEGAILDVPVTVTVRELESLLVTNDAPLQSGMVPGAQSFVNFKIRNNGSVPTGPIRILLPPAGWLSAATASPMPSLGAGQEATVSLLLTPAADLPLTIYSGALQLAGNHNTLTVPFSFRAIAVTTGDLVVHCEDEFTYFADGTPPLAGATVRVVDAVSDTEVASGTTSPDGSVSFPGLLKGHYRIEATAPGHSAYRENIFLASGTTHHVRAFLTRKLIEYVWSVVPTQVEDRYRIVVQSVFETNVPAPVVEITPSYIDLRELTKEVTQIDLTITNHGLIAAKNVALNFSSTDEWQVTPLVDKIGTLAAKSTQTVPLIIRNLDGGLGRSGSCGAPRGEASWCFDCGDWTICLSAGVAFDTGRRCAFIPPVVSGEGEGGSGGPLVVNSDYVPGKGRTISCDPCILGAMLDCFIGFVPSPAIGCTWATGRLAQGCSAAGATTAGCALDTLQTGFGCVCSFTPAGTACNLVNCYIDVLQCVVGATGGSGGGDGCGGCGRQDYSTILAQFEKHGRGIVAMVDFEVTLLGDEAWRPFLTHQHMEAFMRLYRESILPGSEDDAVISAAERAAILATDMTTVVGTVMAEALLDRWNLTVAYYAAGIIETGDLPAGFDPDFIPFDEVRDSSARVVTAHEEAAADGFADPVQAFIAAKDDLFAFLSSGDGVCARVRLQIEQEAVMTRDAFAASLDVINNSTDPISGVGVTLKVTDANGADVTSLFGITPPETTGVGGDAIAGETTGTWRWTLIPSQDAAPVAATTYYVEGEITYEEGGATAHVPLTEQAITVYPNPSLFLKYFHQRDVYADDPFTLPIEPSIPFSLGVMVENRGAGTARNLRITSAEPEIIENEKQLLIGFDIIGSEVAGQEVSPSLTADFGELLPGQVKIARWLLTSTLQGHFINYEASFEHLDSLGDERLSLIESVEIHETIHEINALGAKDDGLPDFFTNDLGDARDLGDTMHLSDGTTAPVTVVETATIDTPTSGNLVVTLNAPAMGAGWSYLRIPDPGAGVFHVVRVTRSDAVEIPLGLNTWTTDRTFVGLGLPPVPEHLLHLVDCDSTGIYTVEFAVIPPPDTTPPTSNVTMLADQSGAFIDLAWSGIDSGGIAFFDVYVSQDGGPFTLWLEGTPATSALFTGNLGSSYAFYSIATDSAGNVEAPKTTGETQTTVSIVNQAPQLDLIPGFQILEGEILRHRVTATDPDGPGALLRFSLTSDQPGLVIDPVTGWLTWVTGEENGGSSTQVTVTVTDGDPDPKSDSQVFAINVEDTNSPPVLSDPGQFAIDVGELLQVQLAATDGDVPAQALGFFLVGTPPAGMTLDPATGLLAWTPGDEHEDQSFEIQLEVLDDQVPAGVGEAVLHIDVLKKPGLPPVFDAFPLLVWLTEGQFSRELTASDPEGEPVTISGDLSGLPGWVALHAEPDTGRAVLEWNTTGVPPGVYQLPLSASTARQQTDSTLAIEIIPRAAFTDYRGWVNSYPLGPIERLDFFEPRHDTLTNLMAYAHGIDPANGIGSVQPDPRLTPVVGATHYGVEFTMPGAGRLDLHYILEISFDLANWTELARKERDGPWTGPTAVSMTPLQGPLERAAVSLPLQPDQAAAFFRLRIERLGTSLAGYQAWIDPFALSPTDADPLSDPNHDQIGNILAYSLDFQSPLATTPVELGRLPVAGLTGGEFALLVTTIDGGKDDLRYFVEESVNGSTWKILAVKEGTGPWAATTAARLVSMSGNATQYAIESSRNPQHFPVVLLRLRVEGIVIPPTP